VACGTNKFVLFVTLTNVSVSVFTSPLSQIVCWQTCEGKGLFLNFT